jgi:hypothetical protein
MENLLITNKIKKQIEALILESILAVLDKLTEQVITIKDTTAKQKTRAEEKF